MIDFGICKEHILSAPEATAPLVVGAEAYWQGLASALGRTPSLAEIDPNRFSADGRLAALVSLFLDRDDIGYRVVGRSLRQIDGDFEGKRLSEMHSWAGTPKLILGHYNMAARLRRPVLGEDYYDDRYSFQWAILPVSSDGHTVDGAVMVHDYDHKIARFETDRDALLETMVAVMERSHAAMFFLRGNHVIHLNARARRLAEARSAVRISGGDLVPLSKELLAALHRARATPEGDVRIIHDGYLVRILNLTEACVLTIRQESDDLDLEALSREVFHLSQAEARLVAALCRGTSIGRFALATGLSDHTVRTQLKSAMARMDLGRQQDIVRMVCLIAGL